MGRERAGGGASTVSGAEVSEPAGNPGIVDASRTVSAIATTGAGASGTVNGTTRTEGVKATSGSVGASGETKDAGDDGERRARAGVRGARATLTRDAGATAGSAGGDATAYDDAGFATDTPRGATSRATANAITTTSKHIHATRPIQDLRRAPTGRGGYESAASLL